MRPCLLPPPLGCACSIAIAHAMPTATQRRTHRRRPQPHCRAPSGHRSRRRSSSSIPSAAAIRPTPEKPAQSDGPSQQAPATTTRPTDGATTCLSRQHDRHAHRHVAKRVQVCRDERAELVLVVLPRKRWRQHLRHSRIIHTRARSSMPTTAAAAAAAAAAAPCELSPSGS